VSDTNRPNHDHRAADERQDQIERLRSLVASHERTIERQQAEIAALRSKHGLSASAERAERLGPPANGHAQKKTAPVAKPIAGGNYTIVFDGGAIGNPGRGYGSYQIVDRDGLVARERLEYGSQITNNQAEYRTLIAALEDLRDRLGRDAKEATIAIRGDSQLVINQVLGRWKVNNIGLRPLHGQILELLAGFGNVDLSWHGRAASVRLLGH